MKDPPRDGSDCLARAPGAPHVAFRLGVGQRGVEESKVTGW